MQETLTISEVAETTGLTAHTLRYYEKAGLLSPIERNHGGHRRYSIRDINSLIFLQRLRLTGMPINQVREYAELMREGPSTIKARQELLERHRQKVINEIADLQQCLKVVEFKIGLYSQGWVPQSESDPSLQEIRRLCGVDSIQNN